MPSPSNEVLLEKIEGLRHEMALWHKHYRDAHDRLHISDNEIISQLKLLNGQVAKNTAFRNQGKIIFGILSVLGTATVGLIVERLFL